MRVRDRAITVQGVLSLVAITAMLFYAAHALQIVPWQADAACAHDALPAASTAQSTAPGERRQDAPTSAVYSGTVLKHGAGFLLRDSAGAVYSLDNPSEAERFAGEPVEVTGVLDQAMKRIHVEKIEKARA